jgi:anti-anti-sigma factor
VPGFERALQTVCADGASAIVIDLSGVTFIDSAALRALLVGHELCISHGAEYWLDRDMASPVKRLLEIAGVGRVPFIGEP